MKARRRTIVALSAAAIAGAGIPVAAIALPTDPKLPDLVADPPDGMYLQQRVLDPGAPSRLLLRFNGYIHNIGTGAADLRGDNPSTVGGVRRMQASQRIYRVDGTSFQYVPQAGEGTPEIRYEEADGHNHWHLMEAARYSLWNEAKTAQVAPGLKVGFCFEDSQRIENPNVNSRVYSDAAVSFCQSGNPGATSVFMGISSGWRDIYGAGLYFQWVDVSEVSPGVYYVAGSVDPHNRVKESDEANNGERFAPTATVIPGYVAKAVTLASLPAAQPATVTLDAVSFGTPGAREFTLLTPPSHGALTLNGAPVAPGQEFTAAELTYTPAPGYSGPDSFLYSANDSTSPFPRTPVPATVTLDVGEAPQPIVTISGAGSVQAGTTAPFGATVLNTAPGVTWSVNGVLGGSAAAGTITAEGLFAAPAAVPPGGTVVVRATSTASPEAFAEATVTITPPPERIPAPNPPVKPPAPPPPPGPGPKPPTTGPILIQGGIDVPTTRLTRTALFVRVVPRKAGVATVTVITGSRRLGRCSTLASKGRAIVCRVTIPKRMARSGFRIVAELKAQDGSRSLKLKQLKAPRWVLLSR